MPSEHITSDSTYVITVERVVAAEATAVFALLVDPARQVELDGSGTVRAVKAAALPLRLSSTFDMHMRRGFAYTTRNTVTSFKPDRLVAWSTQPLTFPLSALIGGRTWTYELWPTAGGTAVRETWDLREERNRWLVARLAGDPGRDMRATLDRLEAMLRNR